MIAPVLEQLRREEEFVLTELNAANDIAQAKLLGVQSVPTLIFYDEKGIEYGRLTGYRRADEIKKYLQNMPGDQSVTGKNLDVKI